MRLPAWHEGAIHKSHDRQGFDCGDGALNAFLRDYAWQSHERGASKTFLAIDDGNNKTVHGFYSLSPASIDYARVPEIVRRGLLGRYDMGAYRLGRLAVSKSLQGKGLGGQLLLAAGRRCLRVAAEVGGTAMVIDAKNARVVEWYASYGAQPLLDAPLTLVLPLTSIATVLKAEGKL